jgi:CRISPR-associated protein Csm4
MYSRLKIVLKFESSFVTPLQSDTLFGEFCWTVLHRFGEDKLKSILREKPGVVFSDGIPDGYLPIPLFPIESFSILSEKNDEEAQKLYEDLKKFKKQRFVSKELFEKFANKGEKITEELFKEFRKRKNTKNFLSSYAKKEEMPHVSIDRLTGTVRKGVLFQTEEYFPETEIAVYTLYNPEVISREELEETFRILGVSGFGAKKSWGKGKFSFRIESFDLKEGNSEFFISLSTGLPKPEEIKDFYAEFFTKFPKHGREFGRKEIFKNPIILSRPGAVYYQVEKQEVYGFFTNLSPVSPEKEHIHSTFVIPFFPGAKK